MRHVSDVNAKGVHLIPLDFGAQGFWGLQLHVWSQYRVQQGMVCGWEHILRTQGPI